MRGSGENLVAERQAAFGVGIAFMFTLRCRLPSGIAVRHSESDGYFGNTSHGKTLTGKIADRLGQTA